MKRIVTTEPPVPPPDESAELLDSEKAIDPSDLLEKAMLVLQREVTNLTIASAKGKLESAHAKDLVQYVELLTEIEADKILKLSQMTDEEVEALAKADRKERNRERMRVKKMGKHANKSTGSSKGADSPEAPQEE